MTPATDKTPHEIAEAIARRQGELETVSLDGSRWLVRNITEALLDMEARTIEKCAKVAENGQTGSPGTPSHLIAYDDGDDARMNAFNTCLLIAKRIRALAKKEEP